MENYIIITLEMRQILVDWLFMVNSEHFKQSLQIFFFGVQIFDAYVKKIRSRVSKLYDIQCIGCACLCIANKLLDPEDIPFGFSDYVYVSKESFSKEDLSYTEAAICTTLEYGFFRLPPMAYDLLCANISEENVEWIDSVHYLLIANLLEISSPKEEDLVDIVLFLSRVKNGIKLGSVAANAKNINLRVLHLIYETACKGEFNSTRHLFHDKSKQHIFRRI
jgi:hypothetical protein